MKKVKKDSDELENIVENCDLIPKSSEFGYQGITYDPKAKVDCEHGLHQLDEVWNRHEHYFSCDNCGLMVHIASVDRTWVKDKPKKVDKKAKLSKV